MKSSTAIAAFTSPDSVGRRGLSSATDRPLGVPTSCKAPSSRRGVGLTELGIRRQLQDLLILQDRSTHLINYTVTCLFHSIGTTVLYSIVILRPKQRLGSLHGSRWEHSRRWSLPAAPAAPERRLASASPRTARRSRLSTASGSAESGARRRDGRGLGRKALNDSGQHADLGQHPVWAVQVPAEPEPLRRKGALRARRSPAHPPGSPSPPPAPLPPWRYRSTPAGSASATRNRYGDPAGHRPRHRSPAHRSPAHRFPATVGLYSAVLTQVRALPAPAGWSRPAASAHRRFESRSCIWLLCLYFVLVPLRAYPSLFSAAADGWLGSFGFSQPQLRHSAQSRSLLRQLRARALIRSLRQWEPHLHGA